MKKIILMSIVLIAFVATAFAQQPGQGRGAKSPEERANNQAQRLTKELSLSADQSTKVKTVLLDTEQKREAIRSKYSGSQDKSAMRTEMQTLKGQKDSQLKQLLTPEQYSQYQSMQAERQNKRPGGGHGPHQH